MPIINKKVKLIAISTIASIFLVLIQNFMYPDAGKYKQNNRAQFTFQLNYWEHELTKNINNIVSSGVLEKVQLKEKEITLNNEFIFNLSTYSKSMSNLLQPLRFNANVAINLLNETESLAPKGITNKKELDKTINTMNHFASMLDEYSKKEKRLKTFIPELLEAFKYPEKMTDDEKVSATIKQVNLIKEIYSSDNLMLKHNGNPFRFIQDMGNSAYDLLEIYDSLVSNYNERIAHEENKKNTLIIIISILSLAISFKVATIDERNIDSTSNKKPTKITPLTIKNKPINYRWKTNQKIDTIKKNNTRRQK